MIIILLAAALFSCASRSSQQAGSTEEDFRVLRERMVERQLAGRDIDNDRVLEAMASVPRHLFVPESRRESSYRDSPLPIGQGQTISQPYIVALMTQVAEPRPQDRALEVGTGSGYQAAVLSRLVEEVYTIEILPFLAERAEKVFQELDYQNIVTRVGDGYQGWPEQAPFDIIVVTAAPEEIPEPLLNQLAEGGRLIIPVGRTGGFQMLKKVVKKGGELREENILGVRFVPMTGEAQKNPQQ